MSAPNPAVPAQPRKIKLRVDGNVVVPAEPSPIRLELHDQVAFHCDEGHVDIHLDPDSVQAFDRATFKSTGPPWKASKVGNFILRCTVTIPGHPPLGWSESNPDSGTQVIIENTENRQP